MKLLFMLSPILIEEDSDNLSVILDSQVLFDTEKLVSLRAIEV